MIKAIIFDLDGTLVQTEILKAHSYARAAVQISPDSLNQEDVLKAFKDVVGLPRQEVAEKLVERFNLNDAAEALLESLGVGKAWEVLVKIRLDIYEKMINDPNILKEYACPYNIGLLLKSKSLGMKTGLATMSHREQAFRVLELLNIKEEFDFAATRDDVVNGKPDPEIYVLVSKMLNVDPKECLIIEDSLAGIKAALAGGMFCIAVTNIYTRNSVHSSKILDEKLIVDNLENLDSVANDLINRNK